MVYRSHKFHPLTLTQFHVSFLEKYVIRTSRECNKSEFIDLKQSGIFVSTYQTKFHALSRYATQLISTIEERIWFLIRGLNSEL